MLPTNVLYYGKRGPRPERVPLRAGPLSLVDQAGDLRYVRLGQREILRRVYVALRDRNWGTVPGVLSNLQIEPGKDSFRITYQAEHKQADLEFRWQATIAGDPLGTISFEMEGLARSTFERNRIGFCVLHPMRVCAGEGCRIEHTDGVVEEGAFPSTISPHQPYLDITAITHQVRPGLEAEVRLAGDVFEMEDQRNWTDASFKTYSTPLSLPFPVRVPEGTRIQQSVTLSLQGDVPALPAHAAADGLVTLSLGGALPARVPRVGLGVASHGQPLSQRELGRLRAMCLSHLRLDLDLGGPAYLDRLTLVAEEARALGISLEIALHLSPAVSSELATLSEALDSIQPPLGSWLVFDARTGATVAKHIELVRRVLANRRGAVAVGGGTHVYLANLNRERPLIEGLDLVCYSINPQVHAFDNASLVEALETQAVIASSARRLVGGLPLAVTPVTLKPRFSPSATGPEPDSPLGELPSQVDERQVSLLGAGLLSFLAPRSLSTLPRAG